MDIRLAVILATDPECKRIADEFIAVDIEYDRTWEVWKEAAGRRDALASQEAQRAHNKVSKEYRQKSDAWVRNDKLLLFSIWEYANETRADTDQTL